MHKLCMVFLALVMLAACQQTNDLQTVTVNNQYSIDLPNSLVESKDLNNQASLQYQNLKEEFYVIVIDEPKEEAHAALTEISMPLNLSGYTKFLMTEFMASVKVSEKSDSKDVEINGLKTVQLDFSGITQDLDVFFKLAYIEGESHYYQIMTWTLSNRKTEHQEKMNALLVSFKEL